MTITIDTAADRVVNEELLKQRPDLARILTRPTDRCIYEGGPAVTVCTGSLGNRYGLCADCKSSQDRTHIATELMEPFRTRMREAGLLDERAEEFIGAVIVCASATDDPAAEIQDIFRITAEKHGGASRV